MEGQLIFKSIVRKCNRCHKEFIHKWVKRKQQYAQLNQVSHWTEGKKNKIKQEWEDYKLLCRACLKEWFRQDGRKKRFRELIPDKMKRVAFSTYYYRGTLNVDDSVEAYNKKWGTSFGNQQ